MNVVDETLARVPDGGGATRVDLVVETESVQVAVVPKIQHAYVASQLHEVQAQMFGRNDAALVVEPLAHRYPLRVAAIADAERPRCWVEPVAQERISRPSPATRRLAVESVPSMPSHGEPQPRRSHVGPVQLQEPAPATVT